MQSYLFYCLTHEGYSIKILSELLEHCLKQQTACFEINENGIKLRSVDSNGKLLIIIDLKVENFKKYKCSKNFVIGIDTTHFYKILKSIRKKESISLFIEKDNETKLGLSTIYKSMTKKTTSYITIQNVENLEISQGSDEEYGFPIICASSDYQKMCKELSIIGTKNIKIKSKFKYIKFIANNEIFSREVKLGDDDYMSDDEESAKEYVANFETSQLTSLMKIASLNTTLTSNIQIYLDIDLPLRLKSNIGNLGTINLYIKSIEQTNSNME